MADVFSKSKRSFVMSRIRSRGYRATELALAKLLRAHRITGWRRHVQIVVRGRPKRGAARTTPRAVPAFRVRPDFVFLKSRTAVFVDGCFWHGCPRHGTQPKGNAAFWKRKFARNIARDRRVNRALRPAGWRVIRIWECALKKHPSTCLRRIHRALAG